MSENLIKYEIGQEQIELIKNTVAKGATNDELQMFLHQCQRTGLDPLSRQMYFMKYGTKASIVCSIDGFRVVAQRSNEYEGQTSPVWFDEQGNEYNVWLKKTPPSACKVGVWRKGFREPLYAIAVFSEYSSGQNMWQKMPALMIAKVAEALALRKAFPHDLSGLYTPDEMEQAQPAYQKANDPDFEFAPIVKTNELQSLISKANHLNDTEREYYAKRIELTLQNKKLDGRVHAYDKYSIEKDLQQLREELQNLVLEPISYGAMLEELQSIQAHPNFDKLNNAQQAKVQQLIDDISTGEYKREKEYQMVIEKANELLETEQ